MAPILAQTVGRSRKMMASSTCPVGALIRTLDNLFGYEFSSWRDALGIQSRSDARVSHKSHRWRASKTQSNFLARPKKQTYSLGPGLMPTSILSAFQP
jgi:hypothetical protein